MLPRLRDGGAVVSLTVWLGFLPTAAADVVLYFDAAAFASDTGAAVQPELPNLGLVGRHVAQTTVGDLTFVINNGSPEIALILGEFTTLHPGNEIALSDWEALDVTAAFPVYALGSFFVEGIDVPGSCNQLCPCTDATYHVRLLLGTEVVSEFDFNAPNGELSFAGVWSDLPFDRVEYRDLSRVCDNEYWGRFFLGTTPPAHGCVADFNRDGGIDGADVEAFFAAWEGGEAGADVNEDGGIDGADVEFFFERWEAGVC